MSDHPPPLPQQQPDWLTFQAWWQMVIENILDQFSAIEATQAAVEEALVEIARLGSYPQPTDVLTAADVGTTATITIAAHTRVYPGKPDIAVAGGTITGRPFNTDHYVYYDDTTLSDTTPAYVATTVAATAQPAAADGRHFVGYIKTPVDGGATTTGEGPTPPGGGGNWKLDPP